MGQSLLKILQKLAQKHFRNPSLVNETSLIKCLFFPFSVKHNTVYILFYLGLFLLNVFRLTKPERKLTLLLITFYCGIKHITQHVIF